MNKSEIKCASLLFDLVENEGQVGVKTSFEDEGATFEEVIRLKEIANQGRTKLTLKIGGPEALRDIKDSMIIGVKGIVAPMVESAFGLEKFIQCVNKNIPEDIRTSLQLAFNVETINGVKSIDDILATKEAKQLYSVTVGRVDLTASQGLTRDHVNGPLIEEQIIRVFTAVKKKGLKTCLGGAISIDSEELLQKLHSKGLLDKFETRYSIFDTSALKDLPRALGKAQEFELCWLKTKAEKYGLLSIQDAERIVMIEKRLNKK
jgi:hypothetical protein